MGREALATATEGLVRRDPLTHREALVILEQLYDLVLEVEQRRRDQPPPEEVEEFEEWCVATACRRDEALTMNRRRSRQCELLIDQIFNKLMVSVPLETRCAWSQSGW